jgi:hypothetical protein
MYQGTTPTKFGRHAVAEPLRYDLFHFHHGTPLTTVDHEPPVPVLDQEDLLAQGIHTSQLVPGAPDVDALGSCTCNAGTVSLLERMTAKFGPQGFALPSIDFVTASETDAVASERFAITLYHEVTDQTGDPAQEWPPIDCGSTGLYVCQELITRKLITSYRSAANVDAALELLLEGTVIMGGPWFNAWMEPDAHGFVDGDGSLAALEAAVESGVAGGHETCLTAIEQITPSPVIRVRNSWSAAWGDHGSYRIHESTLRYLGSHVDYKQFVI